MTTLPVQDRAAIHSLLRARAQLIVADPETKAPTGGRGWNRPAAAIRSPSVLDSALDGGWLIGIIPQSIGLVVVDVDRPKDENHEPRYDPEADEFVARYKAAVERVLSPPLVQYPTRGGGFHYLYRARREPVRSPTWAGGDIRGAVGHVVLWNAGAFCSATQIRNAAQPADIDRLVAEFPPPVPVREGGVSGFGWDERNIPDLPDLAEGVGRTNYLCSLTMSLAARGILHEHEDAILDATAGWTSSKMPESAYRQKIRRVIDSAYEKAEKAHPHAVVDPNPVDVPAGGPDGEGGGGGGDGGGSGGGGEAWWDEEGDPDEASGAGAAGGKARVSSVSWAVAVGEPMAYAGDLYSQVVTAGEIDGGAERIRRVDFVSLRDRGAENSVIEAATRRLQLVKGSNARTDLARVWQDTVLPYVDGYLRASEGISWDEAFRLVRDGVSEAGWRLWGVPMPDEGAVSLYGPGGQGKSAVARAVALERAVAAGWRVVHLDTEVSGKESRKRFAGLLAGAETGGWVPCGEDARARVERNLKVRALRGVTPEHVYGLREITRGAALVVIDSVSNIDPGGYGMSDDRSAAALYAMLDALDAQRYLLVGHVTKSAAEGKPGRGDGGKKTQIGSVAWTNRARLALQAEEVKTEDTDASLRLVVSKSNCAARAGSKTPKMTVVYVNDNPGDCVARLEVEPVDDLGIAGTETAAPGPDAAAEEAAARRIEEQRVACFAAWDREAAALQALQPEGGSLPAGDFKRADGTAGKNTNRNRWFMEWAAASDLVDVGRQNGRASYRTRPIPDTDPRPENGGDR